jgi:hypothetical protein
VTARRLRTGSVLAIAALHGLALLAWTQPWVDVHLAEGQQLQAGGDVAAPALPALALAGLALAGALTIAGPFFRIVLGALQTVIGTTVAVTSAFAVTDPVAAAAAVIGEATGLSGDDSLRELVASTTISPWPWVAIAAGVVSVLLGIVVLLSWRRWPTASRKYRAVAFESADDASSRPDDWDALSDGRDPTE